MDIIYLLIPLALVLLVVAVFAFFWAVRNDQFDDLEREASRILFEDAAVKEDKKGADKKPVPPRDHS